MFRGDGKVWEQFVEGLACGLCPAGCLMFVPITLLNAGRGMFL